MIEEKSRCGQGEEMSGERTIRVALDATAIGRGKTGNETYLRGLLEGWKKVKPEGIELCPIFSEEGKEEAKMGEVLEFMRRRSIPALLQAKVREYYASTTVKMSPGRMKKLW